MNHKENCEYIKHCNWHKENNKHLCTCSVEPLKDIKDINLADNILIEKDRYKLCPFEKGCLNLKIIETLIVEEILICHNLLKRIGLVG